jgi:DNA-binding GntR family transcriptional regulator
VVSSRLADSSSAVAACRRVGNDNHREVRRSWLLADTAIHQVQRVNVRHMGPQYLRVANDLRGRLAEKEWGIGEPIPTISVLQEYYGIRSLNTIRQAEAILEEEGLLRAEHGRGVFVVAHPGSVPADHDAALEAIDEAMSLLRKARRALARA